MERRARLPPGTDSVGRWRRAGHPIALGHRAVDHGALSTERVEDGVRVVHHAGAHRHVAGLVRGRAGVLGHAERYRSRMNDFIPLVPVDELPADLRAQWDATQRPGLRDFVRMMAHAPDHFRRYNDTY